jgi:hypothetical protein
MASVVARARSVTDEQLREFLQGRDPVWLAEQLVTAARADPLLRARLDLAAGADPGDAYDDRALRTRLKRAIEVADFVEYGGAYSYFHHVGEALDSVAELVAGGFPAVAVGLAEYASDLLEASAELVDDSDGGLREALDRVEEIHLAACSAARPDPVALAESLVNRALASDHEVLLDVLPAYEPVLGSAGTARYRELVEQAWQGLQVGERRGHGTRRFVVTYLMERVAEHSGGTDALVEVLARDVAGAYDVLRIAERLCADGRDQEALEWLGRGMTEFPPDPRLRTLAADCHVRAGRRAAAGELLWANFIGSPSLPNYIALHNATAEQFPAWRERALTVLRDQPARSDRFTPLPFIRAPGRSTLVEVLLWESDLDAAWAAAMTGGCRDELWLRLARLRATIHPADAIPILLAAADQAIGHKKRDSYRFAAGLLGEASALSTRDDDQEAFRSHLAGLRVAHRSKRALREELDRAGLP